MAIQHMTLKSFGSFHRLADSIIGRQSYASRFIDLQPHLIACAALVLAFPFDLEWLYIFSDDSQISPHFNRNDFALFSFVLWKSTDSQESLLGY